LVSDQNGKRQKDMPASVVEIIKSFDYTIVEKGELTLTGV
jgi:hypothetical protein